MLSINKPKSIFATVPGYLHMLVWLVYFEEPSKWRDVPKTLKNVRRQQCLLGPSDFCFGIRFG